MFLRFRKKQDSESALEAKESIREAVLLGHVKELDDALSLMNGKGLSENLRYGLEALRYFRAYYGKDGELEPKESLKKKTAFIMESAWSSELLGMLDEDEALANQA